MGQKRGRCGKQEPLISEHSTIRKLPYGPETGRKTVNNRSLRISKHLFLSRRVAPMKLSLQLRGGQSRESGQGRTNDGAPGSMGPFMYPPFSCNTMAYSVEVPRRNRKIEGVIFTARRRGSLCDEPKVGPQLHGPPFGTPPSSAVAR